MWRRISNTISPSHIGLSLKKIPIQAGTWQESPLLKGCMTCGDDMFQALVNLEDAKQAWIETALDRGLAVPEPEDGIKKKKPSKHIDELEWMTNIADGIINNE